MPTIVGILTFIRMINTTSESLEARKAFIFQHFSFYEPLKFHVQLSMIKNLKPQGVFLVLKKLIDWYERIFYTSASMLFRTSSFSFSLTASESGRSATASKNRKKLCEHHVVSEIYPLLRVSFEP